MSRGEPGVPRSKVGPRGGELVLDEANFTGAGPLGRFSGGELDPLALPQQLEHRSPNCAAMEVMLDSALIADEAEISVDQETRDRTGSAWRIVGGVDRGVGHLARILPS